MFLHAALGQGMVNNDSLILGARFGGILEWGLFCSVGWELCPKSRAQCVRNVHAVHGLPHTHYQECCHEFPRHRAWPKIFWDSIRPFDKLTLWYLILATPVPVAMAVASVFLMV